LAEADDARDAGGGGETCQHREIGVVAIEDRGATRHRLEDLGLCLRDLVDGGEVLQMHHRDRGDDRNVGPREIGQVGDLAGVVHAHLDDRVDGVRRQARERERHAPLIVQIARARMRLGLRGQGRGQHFLGAGLADAAGDTHDLRAGARAGGARQRVEGAFDIRHENHGRIRGHTVGMPRDEGCDGAGRERLGDEVMTIEAHALDGDEEIARHERSTVDGHAARRECRVAPSARRDGDLV
jgi:hypothetical protein